MTPALNPNVERFVGFADTYDRFRPRPPAVVVDILCQVAGVQRPRLVADLGSGTGLATLLWAGRADQVVGIEPSPDMRRQAEARSAGVPGVVFRDGLSTDTGLPDGCADVVTCSQALHWMEPEPTFAEVARILRPDGAFAAIDCDWPPTINREAEEAYATLMRRVGEIERERGLSQDVKRWPKHEHLDRMRASGRFRYTREVLVHSVEQGTAERLVGLARSQGGIASLLKRGLAEQEVGLDRLAEAARRALGKGAGPWYFGYRVRVGVK